MFDAEVAVAPSCCGTDFFGATEDLTGWCAESGGEDGVVGSIKGVEFGLGAGVVEGLTGWVGGVEEFVDGFTFPDDVSW